MTFMKFAAVVLAALLTASVNAQLSAPPRASSYTPAPLTMVAVAKLKLGHTVCIAYKKGKNPVIFVVSIEQLDVFWEKLPEIKECLFKVMTWIGNPKKYVQNMQLLPYYPVVIPTLSGKYQEIGCTQSKGKKGKGTVTEFTFPNLRGKQEIAQFLHETNLRICINQMR